MTKELNTPQTNDKYRVPPYNNGNGGTGGGGGNRGGRGDTSSRGKGSKFAFMLSNHISTQVSVMVVYLDLQEAIPLGGLGVIGNRVVHYIALSCLIVRPILSTMPYT